MMMIIMICLPRPRVLLIIECVLMCVLLCVRISRVCVFESLLIYDDDHLDDDQKLYVYSAKFCV